MTLRSAYFNDWGGAPTVLLWGDATGMRELRDFLRKVQTGSTVGTLSEFCEAVDNKTITVKVSLHPSGMRPDNGKLEWSLSPNHADDFAEMVDVLVSAKGHQYLVCGDGITVTVSVDEYPADLYCRT